MEEKLRCFLLCIKAAVMLQVATMQLFTQVFPPYFLLSYLADIYFDYFAKWLTSFRIRRRPSNSATQVVSNNKTVECFFFLLEFPPCTLWTLCSMYMIELWTASFQGHLLGIHKINCTYKAFNCIFQIS